MNYVFKMLLSFIYPLFGGSFPLFLKERFKMLSYTFQYPFDYRPDLSGWALLTKKERCKIKHRLYELLYDLATNFSEFDDLVITSMWRSKKNNAQVGGKSDSKHLGGFAIDVRDNEVSRKLVSNEKYEVIKSRNCIHIQRSAEFIRNKVLEGM